MDLGLPSTIIGFTGTAHGRPFGTILGAGVLVDSSLITYLNEDLPVMGKPTNHILEEGWLVT